MSSNSLLNTRNAVKQVVAQDDYSIRQEYTTEAQGYTLERRLEWDSKTGELMQDYIELRHESNRNATTSIWYKDRTYSQKSGTYEINLAHCSSEPLEVAKQRNELNNVTVAVAEDVTKGDTPTPPETKQGYWTNVITGVTKERA